MLAAVVALRELRAARIIVAAPVIAGSSYYRIRRVADDVAAVIVPEEFCGVGQWYKIFHKPAVTKSGHFSPTLRAGSLCLLD